MSSIRNKISLAICFLFLLFPLGLFALDKTKPVGTIEGSFNVSPMGHASYDIPIVVPEGVSGVKPTLSLSYNSSGGNGLLGVGWSLTGLPVITRCPQNKAQDGAWSTVSVNYSDRFCLNGQKLFAINGGQYGQNNTEYRTEIDSFVKVVSYGSSGSGPAYFKAWTKDGWVIEYGRTGNSALAGGSTALNSDPIYTVFFQKVLELLGSPYEETISSWSISRMSDIYGNSIEFFYHNDPITGEFLPDRIEYTTHRGSNDQLLAAATKKLVFTYGDGNGGTGDRSDIIRSRFRHKTFTTTKVLEKINTFANDLNVSEYRFVYEQGGYNKLSRLKELHFCGSEDGSANFSCFNPSVFNWASQTEVTLAEPLHSEGLTSGIQQIIPGDFNGDGHTDVLLWHPDNGTLFIHEIVNGQLGSLLDSRTDFYKTYMRNGDPVVARIIPGDFNGDGVSDFAVKHRRYTAIYPVVGGAIQPASYNQALDGDDDTLVFAANLNYDNTTDLLRVTNNSSSGKYEFHAHYVENGSFDLNAALISVTPVTASSSFQNTLTKLGDFNGDGMTDVFMWRGNYNTTAGEYTVYINENGTFVNRPHVDKAFMKEITSCFNVLCTEEELDYEYRAHDIQIGDFNGDGTDDFGFVYAEGGQLHQETSPDDGMSIEIVENGFATGEVIGFIARENKKDQYYVADLDKDGISDVLRFKPEAGGGQPHNQGYVKLHRISSDGIQDPPEILLDNLRNYEDKGFELHVADHNGDSVADIGIWPDNNAGTTTTGMDIYLLTPIFIDRITQITGGLGAKHYVEYDWITNPAIYQPDSQSASDNDEYKPAGDVRDIMRNITMPLTVVTRHKTQNGRGEFNIDNYFYRGGKYHRDGRGFLGFKEVAIETEVRNAANIAVERVAKVFTTYRQDFPYTGSVLLQSSYNLNLGENTFSSAPASAGFLPTGGFLKPDQGWVKTSLNHYATKPSGSGGRPFIYLDNQAETVPPRVLDQSGPSISFLTTSLTFNTYDDFGNPTLIEKRVTAFGETYSTFTNNFYDNHATNGEWRLGRLTSASVSKSGPLDSVPVRNTRFEYYTSGKDKGRIHKEYIEPFTEGVTEEYEELVTSYVYDERGRITKSTVASADLSVPGLTEIPQDYVYLDSAGLYPERQTTDAVTLMTTEKTDSRWGGIKAFTDANNRVTTSVYDGFGRLKSQTNDFSTVTTQHSWCDLSEDCLYKVVTTTTGAPEVINRYDLFGRLLQSETEGFDGQRIYTDVVYDRRGRELKRSDAYYANGSRNWTEFIYDRFDRVSQVSHANGNTETYEYIYLTEGYLTQATLQPPQGTPRITSSLQNALGYTILSTDAAGHDVTYRYDLNGNNTKVSDHAGNVTVMEYNRRGERTKINDPDMGVWEYDYYADGKLKSQTTAKNETTTLTYDAIGRIKTQDVPGFGISTWHYDSGLGAKGALSSIEGPEGYKKTFDYNVYGLLERATTELGPLPQDRFSVETYYDTLGRLQRQVYPDSGLQASPFSLEYFYQAQGHLSHVKRLDNQTEVWRATDETAQGLLASARLGNGVNINHTYDEQTYSLERSRAGVNNSLQDAHYQFTTLGNLTSRTEGTLTEHFEFDILDRLVSSQVNQLTKVDYEYDILGNITYRSDVGTYEYLNGRPHAVSRIIPGTRSSPGQSHVHNVLFDPLAGSIDDDLLGWIRVPGMHDTAFLYDANGNMVSGNGRKINYMAFNKPRAIEGLSHRVEFQYDADHNRVRKYSYKKPVVPQQSDTPLSPLRQPVVLEETTTYIGGLYERIDTATGSEHKYFIAVGGKLVSVYSEKSATEKETHYFLHDHLGSITVVLDDNGTVVERMSYDAFGKPRNAETWQADPNVLASAITNRGFTQHEQLDQLGLIHMNGRIYDPALGRFLSPDPFVQAPGNMQNLNRYSYVLNNPLSYTDPSGYFFKPLMRNFKKFLARYNRQINSVAVGAMITVMTGGMGAPAWLAGGLSSLGSAHVSGAGRDDLIGAFAMGAVTGRIGTVYGDDLVARSLAHGVARGTYASINGENFGESFMSAAVSVFISDMHETDSLLERGVMAMVAGGTASVVSGGKFENGAMTAGYVYLQNFLAHVVYFAGRYALKEGIKRGPGLWNRVKKAWNKFNKGCDCCFQAGTLVLAADGYVAIEQLNIGDLVYSKDPETGDVALKPVTHLILTEGKAIYSLLFQDQFGEVEELVATNDHPFWVKGLGWMNSGDLEAGMEVETYEGHFTEVNSVTPLGRVEDTFNITVADYHTYYAGDFGVLVHNCDNCDVTREERWMELANEPNSRLPKEVVDHIKRHDGKGVAGRFGLELAHKPKKAAAQGYDYSEAIPKTAADHRGIQHRYLKERSTGTTISMPKKKRGTGKLSLPPKGVLP